MEKQLKSLTNNIMPNRDGTGPTGAGPKTGRGLGDCKDDKKNPEPPQPFRRKGGRGMGRNRD